MIESAGKLFCLGAEEHTRHDFLFFLIHMEEAVADDLTFQIHFIKFTVFGVNRTGEGFAAEVHHKDGVAERIGLSDIAVKRITAVKSLTLLRHRCFRSNNALVEHIRCMDVSISIFQAIKPVAAVFQMSGGNQDRFFVHITEYFSPLRLSFGQQRDFLSVQFKNIDVAGMGNIVAFHS